MDVQHLRAEHTVTEHEHGENCGHESIPHNDHNDYLHGGHQHCRHNDHYDELSPIEEAKSSS